MDCHSMPHMLGLQPRAGLGDQHFLTFLFKSPDVQYEYHVANAHVVHVAGAGCFI